mgnify:CR=1 FL=1
MPPAQLVPVGQVTGDVMVLGDALAILGITMFVLAPWIVPIFTPGFDAATTATTVELTRIMLAVGRFASVPTAVGLARSSG